MFLFVLLIFRQIHTKKQNKKLSPSPMKGVYTTYAQFLDSFEQIVKFAHVSPLCGRKKDFRNLIKISREKYFLLANLRKIKTKEEK